MSSPSRRATSEDLETIAEFNRTDATFPDNVTLIHLIESQVKARLHETAVICEHDTAFGSSSLTFSQINEKANQLATVLKTKGVAPGQIVGLVVERSFSMILGILGILKAGAAYLPISPENPPERIRYLLKDAACTILLVQKKTAEKTQFEGTMIQLDDLDLYTGRGSDLPASASARDLAYVIYTSGSTGRPKGVMIEHRSVINRLHWMQYVYPIGNDDVVLQKTPYSFDVSVWELFWWAIQGAKLCFLAPNLENNPLAIIKTAKKHRVTVLHFVPSMLNVFLDYLEGNEERVRDGLSSVRRIFVSGEALTPSHVRKFNAVWGKYTRARLTNLYGPTEATVDVTYFDCPQSGVIDRIPIGKPIHNTRMYVIQDGEEIAIGETGELCIAGVGLARGYLNNVEMTDEKFTVHPTKAGERIYRTGDIARWLPEGNIEYLGREDHQIKVRGLRIELGEIENTIREFPGVSDAIAVVNRYSESVILIIAYVVAKENVAISTLKEFLRTRLPGYMVPNHVERIEKIPLTPSGKADRKALPDVSL